jgi:bacitracin synthase 3
MPTLDANRDYWIDKLGRFGQSARVLPNALPSCSATAASATAACHPAAGAVPLGRLGLAALALIVTRYNGAEPVLIATPDGADPNAFRFIAPGPSDPGEAVGAFLDRLTAEVEEAERWAPVTLDALSSAFGLDPQRGDAAARAFLQLGYLAGDPAAALSSRARAGVMVHVHATESDVRVTVTVKAGEWPGPLVPQLADAIARAIEWLAARRDRRLDDFDVVSAAERAQLGRGFNDTQVPLPAGLTLDGLIAAQARRTPGNIAVVHNGVELTYEAFDARASHLAAMLRRDFGVATGDRVGVMMARSDQAIVALYGVMKAGAAYVPINPRHPWDTVRYMIENAGISVLIVDAESVAGASNFAGRLFVIDIELRGAPSRAPAGDQAPEARAGETDLAYVIYTSGSTGRPKGVAIEHRAVVNTMLWRNAFYGISASDINLQIPSFAFDSSVVDIFCVLTVGGTLVVPDEELRLDARHLLELSAARGVTTCIVTPSYYRLLLSELAGAVPTLRSVTLAGESATPELVARHLTALPGVKLYNEYGPTENAVCSTACLIETAEPTVSIGQPIWNVTVLVIDAGGRLAPIGVPGEIYLGGAGLARGYLNQDALTAERFVPSPVADACAGTMYRTGDRACWRPDGSLEFLGRLDRQVKVRGVRIELDDIELALRAHPGVRDAAVICKPDAAGANYLSAFVEPHTTLTRAELRAHMATAVPSYMIPDAFTVLPELPLNLNGKVDRATLSGIDDTGAPAEAERVPLSPVQAALLGLWAEVLQRNQVALDDNFFTMGGNSLRVMELTSRIRGELSLGVELLDVYTYPTVRELADRLTHTPR